MGNMLNYVRNEDELRERFVGYAFKQDPRIKDLGDFQDALFSYFESDVGKNASRLFNDEVLMELFDSQECRDKISANISNSEFQRIFGEGVKMKMPDREIVVTKPKKIEVKNYLRSGVFVHSYRRTYANWTPAQVKFLTVKKAKKITPKQIVTEFNEHFKDSQRTSSSIKTKMFRL
jgi:hypothetical protein